MLPPFVWSDDCLRHEPEAEVWVGVRTPATEVPARALAIREALAAAGAREVAVVAHDDSALLAVHDPALVEFLRAAWDEWSVAELPSDRVVPYIFARSELTGGRAPATPTAVWARPGLFAYDTMTLIGPGTWEAARAAVDVALTAVDLVDADARIRGHRDGHSTVVDAADRMRRREVDGRLEQAPLPDLERSRQLARTVEHRRAGRERKRRRDDSGHAGPLDRDVTDRDPDVGDRVPRPGLERANDDAVLARP